MVELLKNRVVVFGCVALILFAATFVCIRVMRQPRVFAGDRVETRTCRECGGSGKEGKNYEGEGGPPPGYPAPGSACIACGGSGKVEVVLPGPNHPVMIKGKVFEGVETSDEAMAMEEMMEDRDPRKPVRGAIDGATIRFERGSDVVELKSPGTGRFRAELPPGTWKVTATASGFKPMSREFVVPQLTEPIWTERARIVRPTDNGPVALSIALQR